MNVRTLVAKQFVTTVLRRFYRLKFGCFSTPWTRHYVVKKCTVHSIKSFVRVYCVQYRPATWMTISEHFSRSLQDMLNFFHRNIPTKKIDSQTFTIPQRRLQTLQYLIVSRRVRIASLVFSFFFWTVFLQVIGRVDVSQPPPSHSAVSEEFQAE